MSTEVESTVDLAIFIKADIDSGESIRALLANDKKVENAVLENNKVVIFVKKRCLNYHLDNYRKSQCYSNNARSCCCWKIY